MTIVEAIILGLVQGATEFLPISSSGHLILVPAVFGLTEPQLNVIAIAHLGTLLAVLIYFAKDLWAIAQAVLADLFRGQPLATTESRLGWFIVVGSIPAAVLGLSMEDYIDEVLGTPQFAAMFLLGTALLLVVGEALHTRAGAKTFVAMNWRDAIVIGFAQALALLPGISRSGSTIVAGLICGLDRQTAARYSFLLGVPVILGAGLFSAVKLSDDPTINEQIPMLAVTFVTAAVSGFACIHLLLQWIRKRSLIPFAVYCAAFALFYLIVY